MIQSPIGLKEVVIQAINFSALGDPREYGREPSESYQSKGM
jgi:hypothetical protein